jgi:DNA-directed RNA polymerase subunit A"
VIENQGLNVDIRHIMLVADTMTVSGKIRGITRYGIISEKSSVLARASFETPLRHLFNASLIGEIDDLNSVIENVMLNQPVPVGTGLPDLITKIKK